MAQITSKGWPAGATVSVYAGNPSPGMPLGGVVTSGVADAQGDVTLSGLVTRQAYTATSPTMRRTFVMPDGEQENISQGASRPLAKMIADLSDQIDGLGAGTAPEPNVQTGNYTLALGDADGAVEFNSVTSVGGTIPPNSTVPFAIGTIVEFCQLGAGALTIIAGAGVTIRSRGGLLQIAGQYGCASARKRATDEWVLVGDLA